MKTLYIILNLLCALYWTFQLIALIVGRLHPDNFTIGIGFALVILLFINLIIGSIRNP